MFSILHTIYLNFKLQRIKQYKILNFLQDYHTIEMTVESFSRPWNRGAQIILFGGQMGILWGDGGLKRITMKIIPLQSL
jgi:hypothetical protein